MFGRLRTFNPRPKGEARSANGTFVRWRSFEKAIAFSKKQRHCSEADAIALQQAQGRISGRQGSGEPCSPAGFGAEPQKNQDN